MAEFSAPDGRRFTAKKETRRYARGPLWTLVPVGLKDDGSRDALAHLLFLEEKQIIFFDTSGPVPEVRDTGWALSDRVLER